MDSERQIVQAMQKSIRDLALDARTDEACKDIIGLGLKEAIQRLYPGSGESLLQEIVQRYRHHWFNGGEKSVLFAGAEDTLYQLKAAGYQLAVATGKGRAGLQKVLDETGLHKVFDATRCSDETRSKPHPQMLHEILEDLRIEPQHAIMVGDTEYDLQMAHNAGVGCVAVSYGVHEASRLMTLKPLLCVDDIAELQHLLLEKPALDAGQTMN